MKIGDLARRAGLSTHTIRYYERIGLLPRAPRMSSQRDCDGTILPWIGFIGRLKTALNGVFAAKEVFADHPA
jgi:DNA-binding transcriptional MerR regulator